MPPVFDVHRMVIEIKSAVRCAHALEKTPPPTPPTLHVRKGVGWDPSVSRLSLSSARTCSPSSVALPEIVTSLNSLPGHRSVTKDAAGLFKRLLSFSCFHRLRAERALI
jgi:hypothetical protein